MSKSTSSKTNAALWTVQVILAALFIFGGGFKLVTPIADMTKQMHIALPGAFIRSIGVLELLGGLGLILPGLLRLRSSLTPLAAGGLVLIMCGAIGVTVATAPFQTAVVPFVVGLLAAAVAYGRSVLLPISSTKSRSSTQPVAARLVQNAA